MKSHLVSFLFFAIAAGMISGCRPSTQQTVGSIQRVDARLDELLPEGAQMEVLAEGFEWTEGPVWVPGESFLLFSDIPKNTIYQWKEEGGVSVYLRPAGYTG